MLFKITTRNRKLDKNKNKNEFKRERAMWYSTQQTLTSSVLE